MAKAEHLEKGENPRFVVTSLSGEAWPAQARYEEHYCGRGDMENRIIALGKLGRGETERD